MTTTLQNLQDSLLPTELRSPLTPDRLAGGHWWTGPEWPEPLRAGLIEPRRGYRYRPENLLLPSVLKGIRADRLVDLGAGTGALLLLGAWAVGAAHAVGVELQPEVAERLRRTLGARAASGEYTVVEGDLRQDTCREQIKTALGGLADVVVANPPVFPAGWGRPSNNPTSRLSTHAERGDVGDFLAAAVAISHPEATIAIVFDAQRLAELLARAGEVGLGLDALWWVPDQRPGKSRQPFRVWVRLSRGGAPVTRIAEPVNKGA